MHLIKLPLAIYICLMLALASPANAQTSTREGYKGIVIKSGSRKAGEHFTFANISTARPFVTYPSGNGAETIKVFENDELLVLVFVAAATGSTETFYISKTRNSFTLIEVGALKATVMGTEFQPDVTYGKIQ